jgi:hypothetical protein
LEFSDGSFFSEVASIPIKKRAPQSGSSALLNPIRPVYSAGFTGIISGFEGISGSF